MMRIVRKAVCQILTTKTFVILMMKIVIIHFIFKKSVEEGKKQGEVEKNPEIVEGEEMAEEN